MWHILFDLLLVSAGMGMGVVLMCILQVGKEADTHLEEMERSNKNELWTEPLQLVLSNAQSLVLMAIVVIGIYLGFKREFSKLIGFLVIALIAVGLVFNAGGVKDVLLNLFNKIIGA